MNPGFRRSKIIATLGPASRDPAALKGLLSEGVNAFRLNCSHASIRELAHTVQDIRSASLKARTPCAILLDLQGPRLRTGRLRNSEPVTLAKGASVRITTRDIPGTEEELSTNYRDLPRKVSKGGRILLDDGSIELEVVRTLPQAVDCRVAVGGVLKEHKGLNLPGADLDLPTLTPKDLKDLEAGLKLGVDYVALSFVRDASSIQAARRIVQSKRSHALLIAKIERPEALANIQAILEASDGIMVARGDLAVELSAPQVPIIQKELLTHANRTGRIGIVATQMLESMIRNPHPTRAEASDVANAIFDGADAVMLSAETAVGSYPGLAVRTMAEIILQAEASGFVTPRTPAPSRDGDSVGYAHALAQAATAACQQSAAKAVSVFTLTGWSARIMAKYRPPVPIYSLTPNPGVRNQMALFWGVVPVLCPHIKSTDAMIQRGESIMMKVGALKRGDTVIVMAGSSRRHHASNMIKIHRLGSLG